MSPSSRIDRCEPGRTNPPLAQPRARLRTADGSSFLWLPTAAFLISVGLLHWIFIRVALSNAVDAFPIAHSSPESVGIISILVPRMATILPVVALLLFLQLRFGLVGQRGSIVRTVVALFVAAILEWVMFLAGLMIVDRHLGTDTIGLVPGHVFGIVYRMLVLGVGMLLFALGSQWRRMKSLELRAAEAQLQPHFLFNALTAVLACRHDPEAVANLTIGLSEHLRSCLSRQGILEPLGREIHSLEHYLTVQRARFARKLDCRITCSAEARQVLVPPVIVEPLLDNALKHGAATSPSPLRIVIDCRVDATTLVVTVDNTGSWIEPGADGRHGTGLANLRKRIELLDLHDASLECGPVAGGVRARLRMPAVPMPSDADATAAVATGGGDR
jgi:hypothetical protein